MKAKILGIGLLFWGISCGNKVLDKTSAQNSASDQDVTQGTIPEVPEGRCSGEILITDSSELKLSDLTGCEVIKGSLSIQYLTNTKNMEELRFLREVQGTLRVVNNSALESLKGLDKLSIIGGGLNVALNPKLTSFEGLQTLESIGGNVIIDKNSSLKDTGHLTLLREVKGRLSVYRSSSLESLNGFENITELSGLELIENEGLQVLRLPKLKSIDGKVRLVDNKGLVNLDWFTALEKITDGLTATGNIGMQKLFDSSLLSLLEGEVLISNNQDLLTLNAPNAKGTLSALDIQNNALFSTLDLSSLDSVSGQMAVTNNESLTGIKTGSVKSVGGDLTITELKSATSIDLRSLASHEGTINISQNESLNLVQMSSIARVKHLIVNDNPKLENLNTLTNLTTVSGFLQIARNESFSQLTGFVQLAGEIGGGIELNSLPQLVSLSPLSNVTSVRGILYVIGTGVASLDGLSNIASIATDLDLSFNNNLTDMSQLSKLTNIPGSVTLSSLQEEEAKPSSQLTSLNGLHNITSIGGNLRLFNQENLTSFEGLNSLTQVGGFLEINDNDRLAGLQGFGVSQVVGELRIMQNRCLTGASIQSIITGSGANVVVNDANSSGVGTAECPAPVTP